MQTSRIENRGLEMTFKRLHRSQKELKLNLVEILDSIYFGDYSSIYQTKEDFRRIYRGLQMTSKEFR